MLPRSSSYSPSLSPCCSLLFSPALLLSVSLPASLIASLSLSHSLSLSSFSWSLSLTVSLTHCLVFPLMRWLSLSNRPPSRLSLAVSFSLVVSLSLTRQPSGQCSQQSSRLTQSAREFLGVCKSTALGVALEHSLLDAVDDEIAAAERQVQLHAAGAAVRRVGADGRQCDSGAVSRGLRQQLDRRPVLALHPSRSRDCAMPDRHASDRHPRSPCTRAADPASRP